MYTYFNHQTGKYATLNDLRICSKVSMLTV